MDPGSDTGNYFDQAEYFTGGKSNYVGALGGYRVLRRGLFWKGKIQRIRKYKPSGRVLDIGCAYGYFLYFMKDAYEVHGCDISSHAVGVCKKTFPRRKECFAVHDITKPLPYPDGYFDVIICQDVIEHVPDIMPPLRHIRAALKDDGIFLFRVPIKTRYKATEVLRMERDPTHVSVLPEPVLEAKVKEAGFRVMDKRYAWMGMIRLPSFLKFGSDLSMILTKA